MLCRPALCYDLFHNYGGDVSHIQAQVSGLEAGDGDGGGGGGGDGCAPDDTCMVWIESEGYKTDI